MDTTEDLRGIAQDKKRIAARDSSPCDNFEGTSPRDQVCQKCLWLAEEHPEFHAAEAEGA